MNWLTGERVIIREGVVPAVADYAAISTIDMKSFIYIKTDLYTQLLVSLSTLVYEVSQLGNMP